MTRIDRRPFLYRLSRHMRFRPLLALLALAVAGTMLSIGGSDSSQVPAPAADLSQFNPGNIISDQEFFFGAGMSTTDIQTFMVARNPSCVAGPDGSPCLQDYWQDTTSMPSDAQCSGYVGAAHESAATIISKVALSCNVNPKVLLVTLQKERGLVTATGSQLDSHDYLITMGYGCPDSGPCDPTKYGFENQIYHAAWQFQYYAHHPGDYAYQAGRTVNVLYNPNTACGSAPVTIQNQATAGLYIYTPYQPNAAALRGSADGCSAWGNLNFWRYFTDWFISTQSDAIANASPHGVVDALVQTPTGFAASGWTYDPDATGSAVTVRATVDGKTVSTTTTNEARPDVAAAFGVGPNQGFSINGLLGYGTHAVCLVADNVAGLGVQVQLSCQQMTFTDKAPLLNVDQFTEQPDGSVTISGWAFDADGRAAQVQVADNGAAKTYDTTIPRPDVQSAYPAAASVPDSGFWISVPPPSGTHTVCLTAVDTVAPGNNWQVACKTFAYRGPMGVVDNLSQTADGKLHVSGWALDMSIPTAPIQVHVYIDGRGTALTATGSRPDVGRVYPGTGSNHGYSADLPITAGTHFVCVFGINIGVPGPNPVFGCWTMTFRYTSPMGILDYVVPTGDNKVAVGGWVLDPDVPRTPATVHYYVDGRWYEAVTASNQRPDIAAAYPWAGGAHGFASTLDLPTGAHQVCVFAINMGVAGVNPLMDCRTVTVYDKAPIGSVDYLGSASGEILASGWTFDPDSPSATVQVQVSVDGTSAGRFAANGSRTDVGAVYPSAGPAHGFSIAVPAAVGTHDVCVAPVSNAPGAQPTQMRCQRLTIAP